MRKFHSLVFLAGLSILLSNFSHAQPAKKPVDPRNDREKRIGADKAKQIDSILTEYEKLKGDDVETNKKRMHHLRILRRGSEWGDDFRCRMEFGCLSEEFRAQTERRLFSLLKKAKLRDVGPTDLSHHYDDPKEKEANREVFIKAKEPERIISILARVASIDALDPMLDAMVKHNTFGFLAFDEGIGHYLRRMDKSGDLTPERARKVIDRMIALLDEGKLRNESVEAVKNVIEIVRSRSISMRTRIERAQKAAREVCSDDPETRRLLKVFAQSIAAIDRDVKEQDLVVSACQFLPHDEKAKELQAEHKNKSSWGRSRSMTAVPGMWIGSEGYKINERAEKALREIEILDSKMAILERKIAAAKARRANK